MNAEKSLFTPPVRLMLIRHAQHTFLYLPIPQTLHEWSSVENISIFTSSVNLSFCVLFKLKFAASLKLRRVTSRAAVDQPKLGGSNFGAGFAYFGKFIDRMAVNIYGRRFLFHSISDQQNICVIKYIIYTIFYFNMLHFTTFSCL